MRRHLLLAVAALTCPCHLALLAFLLAGTVLGGFISANFGPLVAAFSLVFVAAVWLWLSTPVETPPNARAASRSAEGSALKNQGEHPKEAA
ncbi:MAG: hypothetical protein M0Z94_10980 [Dehalococcoidales bacterium]|nr:hypothetical protein [Dehalococcoidales bacterium]